LRGVELASGSPIVQDLLRFWISDFAEQIRREVGLSSDAW
jgi:hypothetical protein